MQRYRYLILLNKLPVKIPNKLPVPVKVSKEIFAKFAFKNVLILRVAVPYLWNPEQST
jgi:hypothetical protein